MENESGAPTDAVTATSTRSSRLRDDTLLGMLLSRPDNATRLGGSALSLWHIEIMPFMVAMTLLSLAQAQDEPMPDKERLKAMYDGMSVFLRDVVLEDAIKLRGKLDSWAPEGEGSLAEARSKLYASRSVRDLSDPELFEELKTKGEAFKEALLEYLQKRNKPSTLIDSCPEEYLSYRPVPPPDIPLPPSVKAVRDYIKSEQADLTLDWW